MKKLRFSKVVATTALLVLSSATTRVAADQETSPTSTEAAASQSARASSQIGPGEARRGSLRGIAAHRTRLVPTHQVFKDRSIFPDQNGVLGAPLDDRQTKDHRMIVTYVHYVLSVPDVADVHAKVGGQGALSSRTARPRRSVATSTSHAR